MANNLRNVFVFKDSEGDLHMEDMPKVSKDDFFCNLAHIECFSDITEDDVELIIWHGKEWRYMGWQPGMKREFYCPETGENWVGYFPEWEH